MHFPGDYGLLPNLKRVQLFVLSAFFLGSLIVLGIATASGDRFVMSEAIAVCATSGASYVLGRKRSVDLALAVTLCVVAGSVLMSSHFFRGINDVGSSLIPVLILMAGLLLNRRFVFAYATAVILASIGVMAGRWWITRVEAFDASEARDLFLFDLVCVLSAAITVQLAEHIGHSYRRIEESEERFDQLAEHSATVIWEVDAQGLYTYLSHVSEATWGYRPDEVVGRMHFYDLHPEEGREAFKTGAFAVFERKEPFQNFVNPVKRKDGRVIWVSTNGIPLLSADGTLRGYRGSDTDVSERKRAEDILRESEERFRQIADTCPVIIWYGRPDRQLTFLNKQASTFSGRNLEELLGSGWIEHLHPDDLNRLGLALASAVPAQQSFHSEFRLRQHDGVYRWVLGTGVPRLLGGVYVEHAGIVLDITDIKRKQEEVLAAQKLESLGVLAGGIAHDFNNMLGSILAESELVLSELPADSPIVEDVQNIKAVAVRTAEIVGQLLAYAGREGASLESIDLSLLVGEMLQLMRTSISKDAVLNAQLAEDLPLVRANASQVRQIVMNLITNASESLGADGGVITLTTALVRMDPDSVEKTGTDRADRNCVQLEVGDSGCGMTPDIQARIFDPFFTTKFAGRGLGLAAVQGIVRGHGGAIEVESAPGRGTRIRVLLPCADEPAIDERGSAPHDAAGKKGVASGTILLIEDEEALRTPTAKMLRREGFSILEAGDGLAALDLFHTHESRISVVLLDLTLPGMCGADVMAELRRIRPDVKVILTTAYSEEMAVNTVGGQHDWSFIRKPYRISDLASLVRDVLSA